MKELKETEFLFPLPETEEELNRLFEEKGRPFLVRKWSKNANDYILYTNDKEGYTGYQKQLENEKIGFNLVF